MILREGLILRILTHVTAAGPRSTTPTPPPPPKGAQKDGGLPPLPPQAESSLNLYELSFGTVCGICAGVFVKKGAKALAFTLGGVFVLLQVKRTLAHDEKVLTLWATLFSIWGPYP